MKAKKQAQTAAQRKAKQRATMRAWILKQTDGKISTPDGYVKYMMGKTGDTT